MAKARTRQNGDCPIGSPLALAVERFRELAKLIESAPDDSLVRFAFEEGAKRPGAAEVRDAYRAKLGKPPGWSPGGSQVALALGGAIGAPPETDRATEPAPGSSRDAFECPHGETQDLAGEPVCLACGEILPAAVVSSQDAPCQHEWIARGVGSAAYGLPDLIRVFDHCKSCGIGRPPCSSGGHRALVDAAPIVYCATCGRIVSRTDERWDGPAHEVIHHPALTSEPVVRSEPGPVGPGPDFEMTPEEIAAMIDESMRDRESCEEEEILW